MSILPFIKYLHSTYLQKKYEWKRVDSNNDEQKVQKTVNFEIENFFSGELWMRKNTKTKSQKTRKFNCWRRERKTLWTMHFGIRSIPWLVPSRQRSSLCLEKTPPWYSDALTDLQAPDQAPFYYRSKIFCNRTWHMKIATAT